MPDRTDDQIIEDAINKYNQGICVHCDAEIVTERQVGRCAYAYPCGHRIGQGRARTADELAKCKRGGQALIQFNKSQTRAACKLLVDVLAVVADIDEGGKNT